MVTHSNTFKTKATPAVAGLDPTDLTARILQSSDAHSILHLVTPATFMPSMHLLAAAQAATRQSQSCAQLYSMSRPSAAAQSGGCRLGSTVAQVQGVTRWRTPKVRPPQPAMQAPRVTQRPTISSRQWSHTHVVVSWLVGKCRSS